MLAFTVGRSTASLCRPVQLHLCGGKVPLGRVTARRVGWKRFVMGLVVLSWEEVLYLELAVCASMDWACPEKLGLLTELGSGQSTFVRG
jgi:hypothetical protein